MWFSFLSRIWRRRCYMIAIMSDLFEPLFADATAREFAAVDLL